MAFKKTVHAYEPSTGEPIFNLSKSEAKKAGLYLSVTEIQSVEAKPALEYWKINEHIKAAMRTPIIEGEEEANYIKRVRANMWKGSGGAAALGTSIHEGTESVLKGEKTIDDLDSEIRKYVIPCKRYFDSKGFEIIKLEETVVSPLGYGGTADCIAKAPGGQLFVLDWKSTKTKGRSGLPYQGQPEQVSAYASAYFGQGRVESATEIWGANFYISTDEIDDEGHAVSKVVSYDPTELAGHWETFKLVLDLWKKREKYDPTK
jgi:hypothetical protein